MFFFLLKLLSNVLEFIVNSSIERILVLILLSAHVLNPFKYIYKDAANSNFKCP
jgi:hypothetical protein